MSRAWHEDKFMQRNGCFKFSAWDMIQELSNYILCVRDQGGKLCKENVLQRNR